MAFGGSEVTGWIQFYSCIIEEYKFYEFYDYLEYFFKVRTIGYRQVETCLKRNGGSNCTKTE